LNIGSVSDCRVAVFIVVSDRRVDPQCSVRPCCARVLAAMLFNTSSGSCFLAGAAGSALGHGHDHHARPQHHEGHAAARRGPAAGRERVYVHLRTWKAHALPSCANDRYTSSLLVASARRSLCHDGVTHSTGFGRGPAILQNPSLLTHYKRLDVTFYPRAPEASVIST
jgi:hypothetical protein